MQELPETTAEFIEQYKEKHGLTSGYQVGKALGVAPKTARAWLSGVHTLDDDNAIKISHDLGIPSGYVLACMAAERAKRPEVAKVWHDVMRKASGFGMAAFLAVFVLGSSENAQAAGDSAQFKKGTNNIHYTNWLISPLTRLGSFLRSFLLIFGLVATPAAFAGDWSRADTQRESVFFTVLAADWLQTREITRDPAFIETNPLLGTNPTLQQVDQYFAVSALGHYLVARKLTPKWRRHWQYVWIGIEGGCVAHNIRIGVRFRL